jgi:hypothetical protein
MMLTEDNISMMRPMIYMMLSNPDSPVGKYLQQNDELMDKLSGEDEDLCVT